MNIAIIFPDHPGCQHDAEVLHSVLASLLTAGRDLIIPLCVPEAAVYWEGRVVDHKIRIDFAADCVFFIEGIIEHSKLLRASHKVLVPNPEWLEDAMVRLAKQCDQVWHKSRVSVDLLRSLLPDAKHCFVGFTSCDPGTRVVNHTSFLHARGHFATRRNTNAVLQCWQERPDWPDLHIRFHGDNVNIGSSGFLHNRNIHLQPGWLERGDYLRMARDHGIHLCTSEVEGFGHYINEARALGALVVTTDAPPMNELVDAESGILVTPNAAVPFNFGTRYLIDPKDLEAAIDQVVGSDLAIRRRLGEAARHRFEYERGLFHTRVAEAFGQLRG
jgi:glycosyltransferase involved in cell wall biosynthesis